MERLYPTIFESPSAKQTERLYVFALLAVGLLRFLNLGFEDLQAWDEAVYAVRAEGILRFGGFLDQTQFSIGGLYSSFHPPLYVWLTSISYLLFGVTEFAARFFSAVFGGLTLFVVYRLGKELHSAKAGFLAAMLFGLNPFVTFFARQGQFDTTLVFFLSVAILFYSRLDSKRRTSSVMLAGLAVGAALMTKVFVGLGIPLTFVLWKASAQSNKEKGLWKAFLLSLAVMILIAAPWHVYMTVVRGHGNPLFFFDVTSLIERSFSGIESNVKPLEVFYFVNQLFVLFPLGVTWLCFGLYRIFKSKDRSWLLMAVWFALFFVTFSLMRTKLAVYLLPMLLPASLIAAREIVELSTGMYSNRLAAFLIGGTGISFLWASNQSWRNLTKTIAADILHGHLPDFTTMLMYLPFMVLLVSTVFLSFLVYNKDKLHQFRPAISILVLLPSFVLSFYNVVRYDQYQYKDGARELADLIDERQPSTIVVAGFDRNPQLTFYLDGVDIGWRDDIRVKRVAPPANRSQFRVWLSEQTGDLSSDGLLIVEKDKFIRYEWVTAEEVNPVDFTLVFESKRYAAFQRIPSTQLALLTRRPIP